MLLEQAGNGFIMINSTDDKIVLLDEMPESGRRAKPVLDIQIINEIAMTFNKIKQYAVPLKEYLENIAWSHYKKEMISIFVTTKCNLNCDYCFTNKNQNEHKGQTISLEFVKKGIDDYFAQKYMRHVRFFGAGEPTVEFDLLKKIHRYAIEKGGDAVTFEIQTNGAFSDSVAIWLKTQPLPAKAGRFGLLLKQPKVCTLKVISYPFLLPYLKVIGIALLLQILILNVRFDYFIRHISTARYKISPCP